MLSDIGSVFVLTVAAITALIGCGTVCGIIIAKVKERRFLRAFEESNDATSD